MESFIFRSKSAALCVTMLLCFFALSTSASEKKKDDAQKEAEMEDAEAQAEQEAVRDDLGKLKNTKTSFSGKLILNDPSEEAPANPAVVGTFVDKSGAIYQVKLANQDMLKAVSRFNGKTVAAIGYVRNKGKYLVISVVAPPNAESPVQVRSRRRASGSGGA